MGLFDAIGSVLGTNKSGQAVDAQSAATNEANATLKAIYDQQRADQQPYMQAGYKALEGMQDPAFQKNFTLADFNKDPGYQFRMDEGQKALERSAAAKGGLMNGGTLKALTQYGQNFASNEYQNAYDRFNNDANLRFGRLGTIAGMGQGATNAVGQFASNYGNNVSNNITNMGQAKAGAIIGDANRNAGMINNIIGSAAAIKACDERLKTNIEPLSKEDIAELRAVIKPFKFLYKDQERWGSGEHIGPMAQDLMKSKLGRTLVTKDGEGNLLLDVGKIMILLLAMEGAA